MAEKQERAEDGKEEDAARESGNQPESPSAATKASTKRPPTNLIMETKLVFPRTRTDGKHSA